MVRITTFPHVFVVILSRYTATRGRAISTAEVRSGCRQSMPSSNIDNCARVSDTVPLSAFGHMNRPRSKRLAKRHNPSPSHHSSLIKSPNHVT